MPIIVAPVVVPWDDFLDWVVPYVKGCAVALCVQHIRDSAIKFCEDTRIWQVDHIPVDAVAGKKTYLFSPPPNTKVVRIERVWFQKKEVDPVTEPELKVLYTHWPSVTDSEPRYFFQEGLEDMRLVGFPSVDVAQAIEMKASIKPARSATGIEQSIWERYGEGIAAGALQTLFSTPDKPWSSPQQAGFFETVWTDAKDHARMKIQRGFTRSRIVHANRAGRFR